jgi:hypothetical protein
MKCLLASALILAVAPAAAQEPSLGDTFDMIGRGLEQVQAAQGAEKRCSRHAQMAELLLQQYDEHPGEPVVSITGIIHEMFASPTGTWTVVVTLPDGISCAVASGNAKSLGAMPGLGRPM